MKRHPALQPLSRDHHHFLMWCRNVRWYTEASPRAPDVETLLAEIRGQAPYIESHFETEESKLFPFCEVQLGELVLPHLTRLRTEHEAWRKGLAPALAEAATNIAPLTDLARLLHDHIRYEERVFFPLLQARFTDGEWRVVGRQM
jgi:iron-sulfur cluster repair protein YtfE (RIC family)